MKRSEIALNKKIEFHKQFVHNLYKQLMLLTGFMMHNRHCRRQIILKNNLKIFYIKVNKLINIHCLAFLNY